MTLRSEQEDGLSKYQILNKRKKNTKMSLHSSLMYELDSANKKK